MQVNNKNKNIGFSSLTVDPKVWKNGSFLLKRSVRRALPEMEKHEKQCDIYIKYCSQDFLSIDVARKKYLEPVKNKNKKGFELFRENIRRPFIGVKHSLETISSPREENILETFGAALACCRGDIKRKFERRFGTKVERALKDPEKHAAKLAKKEEHAEKIRKQKVRNAILIQRLKAVRANRQRIEQNSPQTQNSN